MVQCIVDMELIIVNAIQISLKHLATHTHTHTHTYSDYCKKVENSVF